MRAARLLAEIGDCHARFPAPEALACLAGVVPSTRQSGWEELSNKMKDVLKRAGLVDKKGRIL